MEILFVVLIGAAMGGIARYSIPGRERSGVMLLPAVGAASASALWVALTWAGLAWDGGLIWWLSLLGSAVLSVAAALLLGRRRTAHDEARFAELAR